MSNTKQIRSNVRFGKYVESHTVLPVESKMGASDMISWGAKNDYPEYLLSLFNSTASLHSIIMGCIDYVVGNNVTTKHNLYEDLYMNKEHDTIEDLVRLLAEDYYRYGGFALQIIRNVNGEIGEIYHLDMRFLRTNSECDVFYYSEDFGSKYVKKTDIIEYPKFVPGFDAAASVLYVKNTHTQVYPAPLYGAAIKACEVERAIDEYHLSTINNNFVASAFVNFNNGIPEDEQKDEIEREFNEKFGGASNGGRMGFSWNEDKEHETTITQLKVEEFAAQYEALSKHCRQQIFTAFRANPNLFGIPTESLGFSAEEYQSAFNLFSKTMIKPVQNLIIGSFDKIFGSKDTVFIEPFSLV